jgi:hypothetical protein
VKRRRAAGGDEDGERRSARPWWWRLVLRRPVDTIACAVAAVAVGAIIVNGLYLQHGPHPAPMFAVKPLPIATGEPADYTGVLPRPRPGELESAKHDAAAARTRAETADNAHPKAVTAPAAHRDAIAQLLATGSVAPPAPPPAQSPAGPLPRAAAPSRQVLAVQRALSDFGYGQIKPTGVYDSETRLAIQHFERDHKLPITGEISDRVTHELANLTGREID